MSTRAPAVASGAPLPAGLAPGSPSASRSASRPGLPAGLIESLSGAFTVEVSARLPRLLAAARDLGHDDPAVASAAVAAVVSDVHTLASSAAVVGAEAAAHAGRACEALLIPYAAGPAEPLPPQVAAKAGALARGVGRALARWYDGPALPEPRAARDEECA